MHASPLSRPPTATGLATGLLFEGKGSHRFRGRDVFDVTEPLVPDLRTQLRDWLVRAAISVRQDRLDALDERTLDTILSRVGLPGFYELLQEHGLVERPSAAKESSLAA